MDVIHATGTVDNVGKLALNVHADTHLSPGVVEVCIVVDKVQIVSDTSTILAEQQHNNIKDYLLSGPSLDGLEIVRDMSTTRSVEF